MPPVPIHPISDERVTHEFAVLNGRRYHYVHGMPKNRKPRATVLCIHGFPDLWYGWRYVIPALLDMGLRVIVPDMIGYGQTDAPHCPPDKLEPYSWKSTANDMAELLRQLEIPQVILLGHDWGGLVVYRIYFWYPQMISHIMCLCTSYRPPVKQFIPIKEVVKMIPSFRYQIGFQNPQTEKDMETLENIAKFMRAVHRITGDPGTGTMQVEKDLMKSLGDQPMPKHWSDLDYGYYLEEYRRNGMHGPLNWYKIEYQNYLDEKDLKIKTIDVPVLWVGATRDTATPASMGGGQRKYIPDLTIREVNASHWVMVENVDETLAHIREFLHNVVFKDGQKAKL